MKNTWWLACFLVAGCQFGDDLVLRAGPDAGTGRDSTVMQPTDVAIDSPMATACTLVPPQSGCSGATPACDVDDDGKTFCRAVTKQGTSNNHCAADSECKDGYTCVGDGVATHEKVCSRFCELDNNCTGIGSRCLIELTGANNQPLDVSVCTNACDPVAQTGCPSGMGCVAEDFATGDYTDCVYVGTKAVGATCASSLECSAGSTCSGNATAGYTCKLLCVVNSANPCPSTLQTCTGLVGGLNIGSATYGVCR